MDSRTAKRIAAEAQYGARYDTKIKLWQFSKGDGQHNLTLTAVQLEKMQPDQLRKKLAIVPAPKAKKSAFSPAAVITLLVIENPKRPGSAAHAIYAHYAMPGLTVADFYKAGGTAADLHWDIAHKYIIVTVKKPS